MAVFLAKLGIIVKRLRSYSTSQETGRKTLKPFKGLG